MSSEAPAVVLFDGVCNLCHGSVNFIIDRDPKSRFRFAPLQGERAGALLVSHGKQALAAGTDPDSIVLVEGERVYEHSTAALRIARRLSGLWPALYYLFIWIPRPIRDVVYRFVARNRYRWFGKSDACRMPTPALKARFLDEAA